jgi:ribosomal protein L37E
MTTFQRSACREMVKIIKERGKGLRSKIKCSNCGEKSFIDGKCDICGYTSDLCDKHGVKLTNGKCFLCEKTPDLPMCLIHKIQLEDGKCPSCHERIKDLTDDETKELIKIIKEDYPEIKDDPDSIERIINWFTQSNRKHFIIFTDLRSSSIFINHHDFQDKFVIIELNTKHPFYTYFIENIIKEDDIDNLTPLLLFIASWIETEKKDYSNSEILERFRSSFGTNLMEVIANWK